MKPSSATDCTCFTHPLTGDPSTRERKERCPVHGPESRDGERDYYAEAQRILDGESMLLPQIEHLRAVDEASRSEIGKPHAEQDSWNAAINAAADVAMQAWVSENSLAGSKLARKIADRIRDLHLYTAGTG